MRKKGYCLRKKKSWWKKKNKNGENVLSIPNKRDVFPGI